MLVPGEKIPSITLSTLAGEVTLPDTIDSEWYLLIVYRGLHCSVCARYIAALRDQLPRLQELGVKVLATSADSKQRALQARDEWELANVPLGYGLDIDTGKTLGLYRSVQRKPVEPEWFFEPGLYLLDTEGVLTFVSLQNMPFGRTPLDELTSWIERIVEMQIPPRGTGGYPGPEKAGQGTSERLCPVASEVRSGRQQSAQSKLLISLVRRLRISCLQLNPS